MPSSGCQKSALDRKSTRLNSSHGSISYAVCCFKKKRTFAQIGRAHVLTPVTVATQMSTSALQRARHPAVSSTTCCVVVLLVSFFFFFFNDTATTEIYTLSLPDALPILAPFTRNHWPLASPVRLSP